MTEDISGRSNPRKRPSWFAGAACLLVAVVIAGCGGDDNDSGTAGEEASQEQLTLGGALLGPKNDNSVNQAAYMGMVAADKALPNLKLTAVLENQTTEQETFNSIQTLAANNDLVYAFSNTFSPAFETDAPRFPDTQFIGVEAYTPTLHDNFYATAVDWGASSYVTGVIAGHLTKTDVVGFIGGAEIPPTVQSQNAFEDGVKSVNPQAKVLTNITGNFADVALGKEATAAMIQQNADVIMPWLDAGVTGAYQAGEESGKNPAMFKLTIPDCGAYDNVIGTEAVNTVEITKTMIEAVVNGDAKPGVAFIGLQDPDLQTVALCPKYEKNKEVADLTQKTIDDINSGKIKLAPDALNPRPDYKYTEGFPEG
jgi:basic membrane protein A